MSLKTKDATSNNMGGLRVAADVPHFVSLGGGRLSTAVTIHKIPIGYFTIGSATDCGIVVHGSGVQPTHCSICRQENGHVSIKPENLARVLIDGIVIYEETHLRQGSMITIGKSNYLRFNNPAEAQMIKSSMGSNERISMPQIDFSQDSSDNSSTDASSPEQVLNNLTNFIESQEKQNNIHSNKQTNNNLMEKLNNSNIKNILSPKVFTTDSVTVNTPAKDVLGKKFNNFTKNLTQNSVNYAQNITLNDKNVNSKNNNYVNVTPHTNGTTNHNNSNNNSNNSISNKIVKVNNISSNNAKLEPPSPLYDRYPKPGAYGSLKIYPVSTTNNPLPDNLDIEKQYREEASKELEQARLDEILMMCADYEKQHQSQNYNQKCSSNSSSMVQNRIKTNGSLPRDKKNTYGDLGSPYETDPSDEKPFVTIPNTGYENVSFGKAGRLELSLTGNNYDDGCIINVQETSSHNPSGYENIFVSKKYVPQSPRTRIKTCITSPKKVMENTKIANEYDLMIQSFEEKLKNEIKILKENSENKTGKNDDHKNQSLNDLKNQRKDVVEEIRELKTKISDLQRQEEEIFRELDMEKALVTAEMCTENSTLLSMEKNMTTVQNKIHRLEAQRNASRVMQETQQAKLKQSIDVKQNQVESIKQMAKEDYGDFSFQEELNKTIDSLENDKKSFEDLEFQYLEEETEWLAQREELHHDLKTLTKHMDDIQSHIINLKHQKVNNQQIACKDTKVLEQDILTMVQNLEKSREHLKDIDKEIYLLSGREINISDSEDEDDNLPRDKIMSQSLFGSQEILSTAKSSKADLMSMSMNENMFFSNIEMPSKASTPKKILRKFDISEDIAKLLENGQDQLQKADNIGSKDDVRNDSILRLKYNLSPPFEHRSVSLDEGTKNKCLNLSLESDDFEVNPLDKRVPSQDDIDRISAVTTNAPISTLGASYKVIESIREVEKNRQRLLTLQGCHVIEHERQRVHELKKRSQDAATAQYLQIQNSINNVQSVNRDDGERKIDGGNGEMVLKHVDSRKTMTGVSTLPKSSANKTPLSANMQRHSNPELEVLEPENMFQRPLSESNSEFNQEGHLIQKQYKSNNDIRPSPFRLHEINDKRNSTVSDSGTVDRLTSGVKRNVPKHQRPLTRYLPIMSSNLDLRQHIETAGHQITLCPHVIVDSTSCRGYLHKLGATFRGWSRRWFVLDRDKRAFIYYSDKSEKKPRGGAYFPTIDEVYLDHMNVSKSGRPHCTFIVKTKKRSYQLQAASDATARIWIDAIITGAQGNIDY